MTIAAISPIDQSSEDRITRLYLLENRARQAQSVLSILMMMMEDDSPPTDEVVHNVIEAAHELLTV